ncbi:MAG: hypothetical protein V7K89_10450, partial [Nostoc sp.]
PQATGVLPYLASGNGVCSEFSVLTNLAVAITLEVVEYLMGLLAESSEFHDVERLCQLFQRLEDFYFRWCDGEFIDAEDANLPLIKKKQLREQLPEREIELGLRQVDVYTGLNVMILLLELDGYALRKDDLKDKITFHPCGKPNTDQFDSERFLRLPFP